MCPSFEDNGPSNSAGSDVPGKKAVEKSEKVFRNWELSSSNTAACEWVEQILTKLGLQNNKKLFSLIKELCHYCW